MDNRIENLLHELKGIKKYATQEEIEKLHFEDLDPSDFEGCIYGQMTGSCYSERSVDLMTIIKPVFYKDLTWFNREKPSSYNHVTSIEERATSNAYTLVEIEIKNNQENNENIISFLRDEITEEEYLNTL